MNTSYTAVTRGKTIRNGSNVTTANPLHVPVLAQIVIFLEIKVEKNKENIVYAFRRLINPASGVFFVILLGFGISTLELAKTVDTRSFEHTLLERKGVSRTSQKPAQIMTYGALPVPTNAESRREAEFRDKSS